MTDCNIILLSRLCTVFQIDKRLHLINHISAYFPLASQGFRLTPHRLLSRSVSYESPAAAILLLISCCEKKSRHMTV